MASKGNESRQIGRRELKKALAGYLDGRNGRIDINAMGDYLFDRMNPVPIVGYCRRCGDECFNLVDGLCPLCTDELEYERLGGYQW